MKRIFYLIPVFALLLTACEGPQGPPGFDGQNGVNFVGQSFERTINFTATNNYQVSFEIPLTIELLDTDMILVYRLVGQSGGFDIWRLLPETVYTENGGEFKYNFEHNFDFVTLYIEGPSTFDFNTLLDGDRLDQTFRTVILPVDFVNSIDLDITNFTEVMKHVQ
ncbi:dihydrolipoamide dehydrogenase [Psychroserpens sp. AS72]|uniref:dihydrolipoamide dehydrogenase n=1 Tax=Psychroserpens sp. AS72 TaxID=3135775 RepID=UPI0031815EDB